MENLGDDTLFLIRPNTKSTATLPELQADLHRYLLDQPQSYDKSIETTYNLLKQDLSAEELLKIWEIRLSLHIFHNELSRAKKEGINLNNALYIAENANLPLKGGASGEINLAKSGSGAQYPIYPLPKNNNGAIGHNFLVFLLRLKSIPNLNLVNEFYKLCYQLRLKASNYPDKDLLKKQLINISYDVIVVLTITKNYPTLINFLESVRHDLRPKINDSHPDTLYEDFNSSVTLLLVIIDRISKDKTYFKQPGDKQEVFDKILPRTITKFLYALNNFTPQIKTTKSLDPPIENIATVQDLEALIDSSRISGRTICCYLGLLNLQNIYGTKLEGNTVFLTIDKEEGSSDLDNCFRIIKEGWGGYINKVYCLE